jgi:hypothetical protein
MKERSFKHKAIAGLIATSLALGSSIALAQALRPEVGRPLQQASELLKAGKTKEALAKVREADGVANKTPAEQLMLDRMRGATAMRAGDMATAIQSFEAAYGSGKLSNAEQAQVAEQLAFAYSQTKDWHKARDWATKAQKAGASDPQLTQLLAYVNAQTGDYAAVAKEAQAAVTAAEQAGNRPAEADLLRLADALRRSGNTAGETAVIDKLLANYPKKEYFTLYLNRVMAKSSFSSRLALDALRLKAAIGALKSGDDVMEYAQLALQEKQAGEAKKALDEAFAGGLLGKSGEVERQKRLLALATQRAASAPADLKVAEEEAKAAPDGEALLRTGMAFTGIGQSDHGLALMKQGIAKGSLRNAGDANLHLGIALTRAGQKTQAADALRKVGGTDGAADLAHLWQRIQP